MMERVQTTHDATLNIFNSILDSGVSTVGIILPNNDLKFDDVADIFDNIACRIQIEFEKKVALFSTDKFDGNIEQFSREDNPDEIIPRLARDGYSFICYFKSNYFNDSDAWSNSVLRLLKYYKSQFFGISDTISMIYMF